MMPPAASSLSQMNTHRSGNDTGRCTQISALGRKCSTLEVYRGDIRTFLFGLSAAAFTVTGGNLRLRDTRQQLECCLPHPAA